MITDCCYEDYKKLLAPYIRHSYMVVLDFSFKCFATLTSVCDLWEHSVPVSKRINKTVQNLGHVVSI